MRIEYTWREQITLIYFNYSWMDRKLHYSPPVTFSALSGLLFFSFFVQHSIKKKQQQWSPDEYSFVASRCDFKQGFLPYRGNNRLLCDFPYMSVNYSDCFRLLFLSNPYPARYYTKKKNADFLPSILQWIRAVFSQTVWKTLSMEQRGSSMAIYDSSLYAFLSFIARDAMPCILAFYEGYFTARMIRYSSTRTKN